MLIWFDEHLSGVKVIDNDQKIQAQKIKQEAIEIMEDATFQLHKWNSNVRELEDDKSLHYPEEQTFAKEQLNVTNVKDLNGTNVKTRWP